MVRTLKLIEASLSVFLVLAIVALTTMQIVARYGMSNPFTWTEELSRFALIALTFLGSALVAGSRGHIVVDLSGEGGGIVSKIVDFISRILMVAGSVFLALLGAAKAISLGDVKASATGVPLGALYWIMALGFALMALHSLLSFFIKTQERAEGIRGI